MYQQYIGSHGRKFNFTRYKKLQLCKSINTVLVYLTDHPLT